MRNETTGNKIYDVAQLLEGLHFAKSLEELQAAVRVARHALDGILVAEDGRDFHGVAELGAGRTDTSDAEAVKVWLQDQARCMASSLIHQISDGSLCSVVGAPSFAEIVSRGIQRRICHCNDEGRQKGDCLTLCRAQLRCTTI